MTRIDHNQRRAQLVDVISGIVAERGVDAVSVREVASHAGVSIGTVQHYFPTKDRMLAFAVDRVGERVVARMQRSTVDRSIGEGVRKMLLEMLPLDDQRTDEARIWLSFLARAMFTPDLLERAQRVGREVEERLAAAIRRAQQLGDAAPDIDATRAAKVLYTLVDGLTARVLTDPDHIGSTEAVAILDAYLARVFPGIGQRTPAKSDRGKKK